MAAVHILSLSELEPGERPRILEEAAAIFWVTAGSPTFDSPAEGQAFYMRWFGRYLETQPELFFLAVDDGGAAIGYLAGLLDTFSAAARPIAGDIAYYTPSFRAGVASYPSHFHINVKPGHQGKGLGRRLVERLCEDCAVAGSSGIHVVTGAQSRAVDFYRSCGFERVTIAGADPGLAVLVTPLSRREAGKT
jgi:ribosomal protein S18 acetylase RimI-like enzyme